MLYLVSLNAKIWSMEVLKTGKPIEVPPKNGVGPQKKWGQSNTGLIKKVEQFNNILLQLAVRLISTVPSEIGQEIEKGLKLAGEFWHLDRIVVIKIMEGGKKTGVIHSYLAPGIFDSSPRNEATTPWLMEKIKQGVTLRFTCLPDDLPEEADADKEYCLREGVKSCLVLPYQVGGSILGGLIFSSLKTQYLWSDELIEQLSYLAEILASALERKSAAENIAELRRVEQLLSEISAKYINMPIDRIEDVARNDFGRLGSLLDVDRCILHRFGTEEASWITPTYDWQKTAWWSEGKAIHEYMNERPEIIEDMHYLYEKWKKGEIYKVNYLDEGSEDTLRTKRLNSILGVKSVIGVPIMLGGQVAGSIAVGTTRTTRVWSDDIILKLRLFGEVFINALARKQSEESLHDALEQVKRLKDHIEAENIYLREEINFENNFIEVIGNSDALKQILVKVRHVAPTDVSVLLLGETGTGKGVIARAIHNASGHKDRPLIQVNCAALAPTLIESELFGYEKGAFTGANARKNGRFELARGTTLFLDEVGELSLELQTKLLRVLHDGEFERVGGTTTIKTDARIISATNKNLQNEVDAGRFRSDLWYRLSVFPISIPPLRDRIEDIPLFVNYFANKYGKRVGKRFGTVSQKTIEALQKYPWPGNLRELENIIERAAITSPSGRLRIEVPSVRLSPAKRLRPLGEMEREHIIEVLEHTYWKIEGVNGAARILGLNPSTLRLRMRKHNIRRPEFREKTDLS